MTERIPIRIEDMLQAGQPEVSPFETAVTETPANAPKADQRAAMAELHIRYDGRDYQFRNYRYQQLADAIHYAKLIRDREYGQTSSAPSSSS